MIEAPLVQPYKFNSHSLATNCPDYLHWEVIVVDKPVVSAVCYGGKIVIFTGLLNRLESDAEIATIIGHEIGHDVSRHGAEKISKLPLLACRQLFIMLVPDTVIPPSHKLPTFRKQEREADFLGLLMMGSAGYDPRVAPTVYLRLAFKMEVSDNCSTLPDGHTRAALLARPELLRQAIRLYEVRQAGGYGQYSKKLKEEFEEMVRMGVDVHRPPLMELPHCVCPCHS